LVIDSLRGLSRSIPIHSDDIIVGTILAGGVIIYSPIVVVLFRWRLNWKDPAKWNLLEATAILLLFRGLFALWVFGSVAAYGLDTVLEAPWLFADLPFDLVMIFMSIAIFVGSRRFAPRGIMVAVCTLSAILYACDLAWYPDDWWENKLLDAIGILADLGLIALLSYGYLHRRADSLHSG
jgi:hypothetical protein